MTDQHPLTGKICEEIAPWPVRHSAAYDCMRTAADWQLEQVEKWLKDNVAVYAYQGNNMSVCFDENGLLNDLRKAMRPTTTEKSDD